MTDKERAYFDGFAINEGAYFYKRKFVTDETEIKSIFKTIHDNAHSPTKIVEIIKKEVPFSEDRTAICSLKVFQDRTIPSFILDIPCIFQKNEILICYFLLIEIGDYLVLFSRHANGLSSFKNKHMPIMGNVLAGALVSDDTVFTQMSMGNMNLNQYALRNKSYESDDLSQSMPTYGSGRHILKTARIQNDDDTITLGLSTSRVSKIGSSRKTIISLCRWAENVIKGIEQPYDVQDSLMGYFSTPVRWKDYRGSLVPIYLLLDFHELNNLLHRDQLTIKYKIDKNDSYVESNKFLSFLKKHLNGCKTLIEKIAHNEYICDDSYDLLEVVLLKTGIHLKSSGRLDNLYLEGEDGHQIKLISYINKHKCFYIGFEDIQFIYQGGQLHRDGNVLNSTNSLLSIFEGIPEMDKVSSEKGNPTPSSVDFAKDTVFHVVEETFKKGGASHIICDDMGFECADHIILSKDRISFVHSKAKGNPSLSASAFQEVIGQALKNIGNIRNMDVSYKVDHWRGSYFHGTNINVCREGDLELFEDVYKKILNAPNGIKEVCLAIDFISKKELQQALETLKKVIHYAKNMSCLKWFGY